jgi:hypothetical protein
MRKVFVIIVAGMFLISCKKEIKQKGTPIAKVKNMVITQEEIQSQFPDIASPFASPEQKSKILNLAIEAAIFSLAAKDEGFLKEPEVKNKLKWAEIIALADIYIQKKIQPYIQVDPREIENFYQMHRNDFEKEIDVAYIIGRNKDTIEALREKMKSTNPVKVISEMKSSPDLLGNIEKANVGVLKINPELPQPLVNTILSLKVGEISGVVEISPFQYGVVKILEEGKAETKKEEIMQIIQAFLYYQKTQAKRDSILNILKQKYKVEIYKK